MSWYYQVFLNKRDSSVFVNEMKALKMYLIGTCINTLNPKRADEQAILKIPYAENKDWNDTLKWDYVYILTLRSNVELLPK